MGLWWVWMGLTTGHVGPAYSIETARTALLPVSAPSHFGKNFSGPITA